MIELEPCPICEGKAYIERLGTSRCSCIISCEDCGCTLESNEEGTLCGSEWNYRSAIIKDALFELAEDLMKTLVRLYKREVKRELKEKYLEKLGFEKRKVSHQIEYKFFE